MSKRSDFAQKLLDDLRLRKERMGLAQANQRPDPRAADAYDKSKWSFQGSGERVGNKFSSKQSLGGEITRRQSARYSTTPMTEVASKEIVPAAKAGRPRQTMDLSRGLTIAFSYGGKNINWDLYSNPTDKGFILQQTSVNLRGREGGHVSHIHIQEISKCAEKLNKVLKVCSSGLKLERDSIDIGRELLRGATDLEDSLRMLVSLQEASEYMVNPQKKQVRLLEKEEDEPTSATAEQQMIVSRPRLSHYGAQCFLEDGKKQGQAAFFYPTRQTINPKSENHHRNNAMKITNHRRSENRGPSFKAESPLSSIKNDSDSRVVGAPSKATTETVSRHNTNYINDTRQIVSPVSAGHEKARIPNVIAKLMGLEDLPPPNTEPKNIGPDKVMQSMQGTGTATNLRPNAKETRKGVQMAILAEKAALKKEVRKVLQEKESAMTQAIQTFEVMKTNETTNLKMPNTESACPVTKCSEKFLLKIDRSDAERTRKALLDKEQRMTNVNNTNGKENEKKLELILKETQNPLFSSRTTMSKSHRHPQTRHKNQDFLGRVQNVHTEVKGYPMQVYQQKHTNDSRPSKPNAVQSSEFKSRMSKKEQNTKNESDLTNVRNIAPTRERNTKSAHEIRSEKLLSRSTGIIVSRRSAYAIEKKQVKDSLKNSCLGDIMARSRRTIENQVDKKSANETKLGRPLKTDSKSKKENLKSLVHKSLPLIECNATTVPHENENAEEKLTETTASQSPDAKECPHKDKISIPQEMAQENENNGRAGEEILSFDPPKLEQHMQEKAQPTCCDNTIIGDCKTAKGKFQETPTDDSVDTSIHAAPVQQPSDISIREDPELQLNVTVNPAPGSIDSRQQHKSKSNSLKQHDRAVSKFDTREFLADDEKHLREILANSRFFLNNAQAFFKIKIPARTIQAGKTECQDEKSSLTLDCACEVMRRKGKREELSLLSPVEISSSTVKVRCLDDLIKELTDDLKSLQVSCLSEEYLDTTEFLHKLLERDIHDCNSDVNCMWDFSWKNLMFTKRGKYEVVRDLEKHVLNGLINDIVKDLLNVSTSI